MVDGVRDGKRVPGFVVVTDRRVLVLVAKPSKIWGWLFGPFHASLAHDVAPLEMTHQIDRDDFASVELEEKQMISFHSKGDGYAHISFVVYSQTSFVVWQDRMEQWTTGASTAAQMAAVWPGDR